MFTQSVVLYQLWIFSRDFESNLYFLLLFELFECSKCHDWNFYHLKMTYLLIFVCSRNNRILFARFLIYYCRLCVMIAEISCATLAMFCEQAEWLSIVNGKCSNDFLLRCVLFPISVTWHCVMDAHKIMQQTRVNRLGCHQNDQKHSTKIVSLITPNDQIETGRESTSTQLVCWGEHPKHI